jgi:hypothetical protein
MGGKYRDYCMKSAEIMSDDGIWGDQLKHSHSRFVNVVEMSWSKEQSSKLTDIGCNCYIKYASMNSQPISNQAFIIKNCNSVTIESSLIVLPAYTTY